MARSPLIAASVAAVFAAASAAAAADDASLLKQAGELFKPLPPDMATPASPIAGPRVELGTDASDEFVSKVGERLDLRRREMSPVERVVMRWSHALARHDSLLDKPMQRVSS